MEIRYIGVWIAILVLLQTTGALAGTRDDCITKCKEAGQFVLTHGIAKAAREIGDKKGRFVWNDGVSYVFLMTLKARLLAHPYHPELRQLDTLLEIKDINGKHFFEDFVKTARKGKGWTRYTWKVPGKEVEKPKYTFIYRVPGTDYFVGAGFYVMSPGVYH